MPKSLVSVKILKGNQEKDGKAIYAINANGEYLKRLPPAETPSLSPLA